MFEDRMQIFIFDVIYVSETGRIVSILLGSTLLGTISLTV
jgi:hypothetical protein